MRQRADMIDDASYPLSAFSPPPGSAGAPCDATPAPTCTCPLQAPAGLRGRAFTLLEVMIVIGVIGLLVALAIPASTALVNSRRHSNTLATMKVLENAIERYVAERPGAGKPHGPQHFGHLPPDYYPWQPSKPAHCEDFDDSPSGPLHNGKWDLSENIDNDDAELEGVGRFNPACLGGDFRQISSFNGLQRRMSPTSPLVQATAADDWQDFRSIETLYFYISQLSPQGKAVLASLPQNVIGNKDTCGGAPCPDVAILAKTGPNQSDPAATPTATNTVELVEVLDAWGRPLRYQVDYNTPHRWELRSAGSDGNFGPATLVPNTWGGMFTDPDASDDVVLRGE